VRPACIEITPWIIARRPHSESKQNKNNSFYICEENFIRKAKNKKNSLSEYRQFQLSFSI